MSKAILDKTRSTYLHDIFIKFSLPTCDIPNDGLLIINDSNKMQTKFSIQWSRNVANTVIKFNTAPITLFRKPESERKQST